MATNAGTVEVVIGTAKDLRFTLKSAATGAALALVATDKIVFAVRRNLSDPAPLWQRRSAAAGGSAAEIALVDGPNGVLDVLIVEANTTALVPGTYRFDLRYELAAELKDRIACVGTLLALQTAGAAIP